MSTIRYFRTMNAIGDCILSRPFVRRLARKYRLSLQTPFPEIFADLGVDRFVRGKTNVSYASKAIREWGEKRDWRGPPKTPHNGDELEKVHISYDLTSTENVTEQLARSAGMSMDHYQLDLPPDVALTPPTQRYAVIRPVVIRDEFPITARNCAPEYIFAATEALKKAGYVTFAVANIPDEYPVSPYPNVDVNLGRGQLSFLEMLTLVRNADIVVSGPGFAMPMSVAAEKPILAALWGARGKLDNPDRIFHPKMDLSRVHNFFPMVRCPHSTDTCDCSKTYFGFNEAMEKVIAHAQAR